jgi:hypothetical protein
MNTKHLVLAVVAVSALTVPSALAQQTGLNGLSARIGAFFPTERAARNQSKTWFGAGLQYKVRDLHVSSSMLSYKAHVAVSIDFYNRDNYRVVPILANYVADLNEDFFYSAGLGVALTRIPSGGGSSERARFAYQFGVGYNVYKGSNPVFIEGKFFGNADSAVNGFGLFAGIRF